MWSLGVPVSETANDENCPSGSDAIARGEFAQILSRHIKDGVIIQDMDGHILWSNAAYCRISGYRFEEIVGRKPQEFIIPFHLRPSAEEIANFRFDSSLPLYKGFEIIQNQRKNGELFWAQLSFGFYSVPEGERVIITTRDITEQVEAQEDLARAKADLERAVNFDALTGLANRRMLMDYLSDCLARAGEEQSRVGLLHVDLDRFKEINDTHGHAAGDAILQHAATTMTSSLEQQGLAARIGGDEFVLVVPGIESFADIEDVAQAMLLNTVKPVEWEGRQLSYGYSIGAALSEDDLGAGQDLIQKADFALYEAKANGRGRWALYNASLKRKHNAQKGMAADLIRSVKDDQLEFYFQPIMRLTDRRIAGVETLVRWRHPRKGLLMPTEFLGLAEEIGFLEELDLAGMRAAVHASRHITDLGYDDVYVSFNASTHVLADETLVEEMLWATGELDVDPARIAVEVLETVFLEDDMAESQVALQIRKLSEAGFITLLDDFGVGFAGLSHLGHLEVTGLKIDRSLVKDITSKQSDLVIVKAILQLARDLGLRVVAEGAEDERAADLLARFGCEFVQGYFLARPMPLEELSDWMLGFEEPGAGTVEESARVSGNVTRLSG